MKIFKTLLLTAFLLISQLMINAQDCVNFTQGQSNIGIESATFGVSLADFNGDGYQDVVTIAAYEDIEVYFNNGDGTFNTTAHHYGSSDHTRFGVQALDIDNDGDMDFVTVPFYSENIGLEIWKNNGTGVFTMVQNLATYSKGEELAVGDLNNDGYVDIFYPGAWDIFIFLNNQDGTFSSNGQEIETNYANAVVLADLDGDQDLDAVLSFDNSLPGQVWVNDGMGNFSDSGQELTSETTDGVDAGDIDGDGDIDLAFAPWMGDVELWENDGVGNFMPAGTVPNGGFNIDVMLRDQNFDGLPDIFVADHLWLNDTDNPGNFLETNEYFGSGHDFDLADINNDHVLDIYSGNFSSNSGDYIYYGELPDMEFDEMTICANDSAYLENDWQTEDGEYWNYAGCNEVLVTTLSFYDEINTEITMDAGTLTVAEEDAEYQWLDCDNNYSPIEGETNQSYTPLEIGSFAVEVIQNGTCIDTSDCYTSHYVAISNIKDNDFNLTPNPSNGIYNLSFTSKINRNKTIVSISNIAGEVVFQENIIPLEPMKIDISDKPNGIYFLQIFTEDGTETIKIIKE